MTNDDAEIVDQLRQGSVAALAQFIDHRRPQLIAFIRRRLGAGLKRRIDADDIFQETCAEAVRSLTPEWPGSMDPFGWLCQIAERKIVDAHRHHFVAQKRAAGKERPLDGDSTGNAAGLVNLLVRSLTTPSQAFSRNAREQRLQLALAELNEEQREAIRLKYVERLPSKEIAERLNKSDASVRVMLTRTIKKLQSMLSDTS